MSTILKWAGNKTAIMPELIKHLPAGSRLVEPFAGSCAVMMATDYPHQVIVSNSDTFLTRSLYRNFTRHRITAKRSMGVAAGDSKTAVEIIATKSARWFGVDLASGPDISMEAEVRAW
ncbi:TPA: DNA adenine methylase [Salmonella enterica]|nr:DNA adenine methylase [Salmonella enterica]